MSMTTSSVIDEASIAELLELDRLSHRGLFERVVRIFLDRSPALLQDLEDGVAARDTERILNAAHSLKSSSANVGAITLSALCQELEGLGRSGSTTGSQALLAQATVLYEAVATELGERIRSHAS